MTMLYPGDTLETPPLPEVFEYDEETRQLEVKWAFGAIVRYFDIDPRSAFLSPTNERRNRDFINFLETRLRENNPVKSETIQDPTKQINLQMRPGWLLSGQNSQTGGPPKGPWSHKKPVGNDGGA